MHYRFHFFVSAKHFEKNLKNSFVFFVRFFYQIIDKWTNIYYN